MRRFKRILFVVDQSFEKREALARAVALARENDAALTVACVMPPPPHFLSTAALDLAGQDTAGSLQGRVEGELQTVCRAKLDLFVAPTRDQLDRLEVKVLAGRPYLAIIREALQSRNDLVMKPADDNRFLDKLFGSLDLQLMRLCPVPVWIHRPDKTGAYDRILAAVEPSGGDTDEAGLEHEIMSLATAIATREQSELHVVHVWHSGLEEGLLREGMSLEALGPADQLERRVFELHDRRRLWLEKLVARRQRPGLKIRGHLVEGEPTAGILSAAVSQDVDLIVMGTVGRAGLEGLFVGNTADMVMQSTSRSVLAVKPDGFQSPVKL